MQRGEQAVSGKIVRRANIYKHPDLSPGGQPVAPGTTVLGDIHANAITFLFHLVDKKVLNISHEDYQQLVDLYFKADPSKEDFKKFDEILRNATLGENPENFRLMGDDLADRGTNDNFKLLIDKNLMIKEVLFEVILSNHTIEFLRVYLQHINVDVPTKAQMYFNNLSCGPNQDKSLTGLAKAIASGQVSPDQVKEIVEGYKRHLKLLSYDIDRSKTPPSITLYTHAPVGIDIVEKLAKKFFGADYKINSIDELLSTIDKINQHFTSNLDDIIKNFNVSADSDPLTFILWNRAAVVDPFKGNDKKKFPDGSTLNIKYVHGHDGGGMVRPEYQAYVVNLDNVNGKGDTKPRAEEMEMVVYHSPQPLRGPALKTVPAPSMAKPVEVKRTEAKPVEVKRTEPKPAEPKRTEAKPAEVKTREPKPEVGKPMERQAPSLSTMATSPSVASPFDVAATHQVNMDPLTALVARSMLIRNKEEAHDTQFFYPINNPKGLQADFEKIFDCEGQGKISIGIEKKTGDYQLNVGYDIYEKISDYAQVIRKIFLVGLSENIREEHEGLLATNVSQDKLVLSCSDPNPAALKKIIDNFNQLAVATGTPIFVLSADGKSATLDIRAAAKIYLMRMNIGKFDESVGRSVNLKIMEDLNAAVANVKAELEQPSVSESSSVAQAQAAADILKKLDAKFKGADAKAALAKGLKQQAQAPQPSAPPQPSAAPPRPSAPLPSAPQPSAPQPSAPSPAGAQSELFKKLKVSLADLKGLKAGELNPQTQAPQTQAPQTQAPQLQAAEPEASPKQRYEISIRPTVPAGAEVKDKKTPASIFMKFPNKEAAEAFLRDLQKGCDPAFDIKKYGGFARGSEDTLVFKATYSWEDTTPQSQRERHGSLPDFINHYWSLNIPNETIKQNWEKMLVLGDKPLTCTEEIGRPFVIPKVITPAEDTPAPSHRPGQ